MSLRILFTFVGGRGHLEPLLPIAEAARERGHETAFAAARSMAATVQSAGFDFLDARGDEPSRTSASTSSTSPTESEQPPASPFGELLAVDRTREERDLRERFVRDAAPRQAARLVRVAAAWRPDAVVCDEADVGTVVAAERLGIPCATVIVLAAGGMFRPDVVAATLDELRAEHGLAADPSLLRARGGLVIDPTPPAFRDPGDPLRAPMVRAALTPRPVDDASPPPWTPVRPAEPAVYVTLGTEFNRESGDLFGRLTAALTAHPGDVLVTVGPGIDPAALGSVPERVHVERYVSQARVLPHVALVVSHAGSGTILGSLAHGLPMVLLPMGADQPWNGDRCAALGVARVLDPGRATADDIRAAVREVLADASMRAGAGRFRDAMAALPPASAAVEAVEDLVARRHNAE